MTMVKTHKHVCRYIDSFQGSGNKLYLIMEYCEKGDLNQYLVRIKSMARAGSSSQLRSVSPNQKDLNTNDLVALGEHRTWKFFIQICLALEHIHDKGIVHADLKPANMLYAHVWS